MLYQVNLVSVVVRLVLSLLCGGLLGIDREQKRRPAGFRTYTLVCMGAAMVMMTSQYVWETYATGDILRMGAQVVSGIGFLGAGTIIVTGHRQVRGLTTAAGLWVAACLGLAIGIGFYSGALIGTALIFLVLTWFHYLEEKISKRSKVMNLFVELDSVHSVGGLLRAARENALTVSDVEINREHKGENGVAVMMSVSYLGDKNHESVLHILGGAPGVQYVEEY